MDVDDLVQELSAEHQLPHLLKVLGSECLENRRRLAWDKHLADSGIPQQVVESAHEASLSMWSIDGSPQGAPPDELLAKLRALRGSPDLATLMTLEGICWGAAKVYFQGLFSPVVIDHGMVLPLPERPIKSWPATPNPATSQADDLLDPACGFVIWDRDWELELDFTDRERIDAICWAERDGDKRLPRIATVHPFTGSEMALPPDVQADGRFFGVHPRAGTTPSDPTEAQNARTVLEALHRLNDSDVQIAIVPEFTLHDPDSIGSGVSALGETPALIVAGSAHHVRDGGQANTSVTYLDGVEILRVSKQHPFYYKTPVTVTGPTGPTTTTQRFREDVAPRPRRLSVVASDSTRLAVAICSDLNYRDLATILSNAGVNILLCPAWTPKVGVFGGGIEMLASFSQCVSVVANTPGHPAASTDPFWALSMTPEEGAHATTHTGASKSTVAAVIDPNYAPSTTAPHVEWLDWR